MLDHLTIAFTKDFSSPTSKADFDRILELQKWQTSSADFEAVDDLLESYPPLAVPVLDGLPRVT